MNSFFLSCSLPPNTEGSAELCEAIGARVRTQVRTFNTCNLCRILTAPLAGYGVSLTFAASLRSSKSGSLASRQAGTVYGLHSFLYFPSSGDSFRNGGFVFATVMTSFCVTHFVILWFCSYKKSSRVFMPLSALLFSFISLVGIILFCRL